MRASRGWGSGLAAHRAQQERRQVARAGVGRLRLTRWRVTLPRLLDVRDVGPGGGLAVGGAAWLAARGALAVAVAIAAGLVAMLAAGLVTRLVTRLLATGGSLRGAGRFGPADALPDQLLDQADGLAV